MDQIRFPLGLCPRPGWGNIQCSPNLLAAFKGPTSNERDRERERQGRKGTGGEGKEERAGEGTEGRRGPRIQPPPWASQNLGPALTVYAVSECVRV